VLRADAGSRLAAAVLLEPAPAVGSLLLRSGPTPAVGSLLLRSGPTPAVGSLLLAAPRAGAGCSLLLHCGRSLAVGSERRGRQYYVSIIFLFNNIYICYIYIIDEDKTQLRFVSLCIFVARW